MSEDIDSKVKKKIGGLRTFADDVKRAREEQNKQKNIPKIAIESQTEKKQSQTDDNQKTLSLLKQKPEENSDSVDGVIFENDPEIPPFHNIRASSPEETTFDSFEEIPDKKSLQETTLHKKARVSEQKPIVSDKLNIESEIAVIANQKIAPSLGDTSNMLDVASAEQNLGEATIVTDQKRKRFRLFPAIVNSLQSWFIDKKNNFDQIQTKQRTDLTVQKSSQREDTIKKAGERTKQVPKNDYESVRNRQREVVRNTHATTEFTIKKKEESIQDSWEQIKNDIDSGSEKELAETYTYDSPAKETAATSIHKLEEMIRGGSEAVQPETTEEISVGYKSLKKSNDLNGTQESSAMVAERFKNSESIAHTAPAAESINISLETQEQDIDAPTMKPREENTKNVSGGYQQYREKYGEQYTPYEETFLENLPVQTEQVPPETAATPYFNTPPIPKERLAWAAQRQKTTATRQHVRARTPYFTLAVVVVVAMILGTSASIWWFTRDTGSNTPTTITETIPAHKTIALTANRTTFLTTLNAMIKDQESDTSYITPTVGNTQATVGNILDTLSLSADGSFIRNITNIEFGFHEKNPFVIMHVASFDTAFGGILLWETSIHNDFSPLFGNVLRTSAKDIRITNTDTRILTDETGKEVLVYGFVDKQTILIAPTRDVFVDVLPSVR